ncbi:hypothetical protein [Streptomyces platensis]|uniref:hypothetical protein n=1 Tax=Streptomyces platensis TaxID=58346 RepID=UPI00386F5300|nr:hypothetical protein OG962_11185 [Streptomyces platensis]
MIAEIRGVGVGVACQLALACDLRLMADSARIGMPIRAARHPGRPRLRCRPRSPWPGRLWRRVALPPGPHRTAIAAIQQPGVARSYFGRAIAAFLGPSAAVASDLPLKP